MSTAAAVSLIDGPAPVYPRELPVSGSLREQARLRPDAIALTLPRSGANAAAQQLTYRELDARCDAGAALLAARGLGPGSRVAILGERRPELVVALFAILRCGASFVPLDPTHPAEHQARLCALAGAELLIAAAPETRTWWPPATGNGAAALPFAAFEGSADTPFAERVRGDAPAYVTFTSGTTGTPKGVLVPHRAIQRLVVDGVFARLNPDTVTLQLAPLAFDASTFELFASLLNGGRCVLHPEQGSPDLALLERVLRDEGVTTLWLTASLFNLVLDTRPELLRPVRELLVGGEALSVPHVRKALELLPETQLINGYGPTENTTFTCCYRIPRVLPEGLTAIPIGTPIAHTRVIVATQDGRPLPRGTEGELWTGGDGLALGYTSSASEHQERFVPDPLAAEGARRLYRTGDRARIDAEGLVHFCGRIDDQIKLLGHRIEPEEVRLRTLASAQVNDAAIVLREDRPGRPQLIAYVVPRDDVPFDGAALRAQLARELPAPMVPSRVVEIASLPLTPNGKLDRAALPPPARSRPPLRTAFRAARSETEERVLRRWCEVLDLDDAGADDEFFALGGSSLLATRLVLALEAEFGRKVPIAHLFEGATPASLARVLEHEPVSERLRVVPRPVRASSIAIVGMAGRFPGASDVRSFWELLVAGGEGTSFWEPEELALSVSAEERADPRYVRARGVLDGIEDFDAARFGIAPAEAALLDPQQRILLELAEEALADAGYDPERFPGAIGIWAGQRHNDYLHQHLLANPRLRQAPGDFALLLANDKDYVAARIAHRLDLRGPAVSVHTACSTSLVAIHEAVRALRQGDCDMALAGAAAITLPQRTGHRYDAGGMLSSDGHCRPFDAEATGTVFSDGAALLVLKPLEAAQKARDHVYAVIRGSATNNDGAQRSSFTAPSPEGQARVIAHALADAGVEPETVGFVEAHGTATPLGDPIEVEGLLRAFGRADAPSCVLGSVKSNIGHLTAAAGVAGVIKAALSVRTGIVPPTLHFSRPNPNLDLGGRFVVSGRSERYLPAGPRRAGISSFGVGGTNAHVILEEAPAPRPRAAEPAPASHRLCLSARSEAALDAWQTALAPALEDESVRLTDAARTLSEGRRQEAVRRVVWGTDRADLVAALRGERPRQIVRGEARAVGTVAFVFPGQGTQYVGMGRHLYAAEPVFAQCLRDCDELLRPHLDGVSLLALLHGELPDAAERLGETRFTQPALFAIEYAAARLLLSFGLEPELMLGHSVGEFVAACLAGVFSLENALHAVAERGAAMQRMPAGSMLSVRVAAAELELPPELDLAAVNGRTLSVVAGPDAEIDAFAESLLARGMACKKLRTSHAFHSRSMEAAVAPFRAHLAALPLARPERRIVSTVTGRLLTDDEALDPEYWARHMRVPVQFAAAIATAESLGATLWFEAGPGGTGPALVRQSLERPQDARVLTLLGPAGGDAASEQVAFEHALGTAWCLGLPLRDEACHPPGPWGRIPLPSAPFARQRHWIDAEAPARPSTPGPIPSEEAPPMSRHRDQIAARIRARLEEASGLELEAVPEETSFVEIGLDSLLLTQVATALRREFGVDVSFRELNESYSSIAALAEHLVPLVPQAPQAPEADPGASPDFVASPSLTPSPGAPVLAGDLATLFAQQLQILQGQLDALRGRMPSPAATVQDGRAKSPAPDTTAAASEKPRAHGPQLVLQTQRGHELGAVQERHLEQLVAAYTQRTAASKAFTARNRRAVADPRSVAGFQPRLKELVYPIVVTQSSGCHLTDLDGNEYVDLVSGFGSNFFGFGAPFVRDAVTEQMAKGMEIGPQTALVEEVAARFRRFVPMDRVAFCNTGSEAVLATMRLARTVRGRERIVMFEGGYHGIFDEVVVRRTPRGSLPAAPGIPRESVQNLLVLPWNDPAALDAIRAQHDEIAGVLVEPVQSRAPAIQPGPFLQELRALTRELDIPLIFDEVVCGFRVAPGGAQAHFGIEADLATYGKVVGGGFPIGIVAGRHEYMDALDGGHWDYGDESVPSVGVTYFAGTFVRFPPALAAAKAVLEHLEREGPALQQRVNATTDAWVRRMNESFAREQAPLRLEHFASIVRIAQTADAVLPELLAYHLRLRGIHVWDGRPVFLTAAHTEEDLARVERAFAESLEALRGGEFHPRPVARHDAGTPPVPGARLGRDPDGNPAWFVADAGEPSGYREIAKA